MATEGNLISSSISSLQSGDRFELTRLQDGEYALPATLREFGEVVDSVEGADGDEIEVRGGQTLAIPATPESNRHTLWLEFQEEGRYRLVVEPSRVFVNDPEIVTEQGMVIGVEPSDLEELRLSPPLASLPEFQLARQAARLRNHAGFDRLICLPLVRDMELLEHQMQTAGTVLRRFRGRALLCDEVGLGKTIEAGLVFAELKMRGIIRSALVLVPPSLIEQWQGEMRRKFSLDLISHDAPAFRAAGAEAWNQFDLVIASTHTAKREPHRSAILARKWDLVIVDEAHHLRNRTTQLWKFASELQKQFILLLTATPVQNNLEELYNLVTLLEPGLLRTARQFTRQFVDRNDKLAPKNIDELHGLLAEVMVRNRRSTVGLQFTRRWATTECLAPSAAEQTLYEDVAGFVRHRLRQGEGRGTISRMALMSLQMALGSSSQAAAGILKTLLQNDKLPAADGDSLTGLAFQAGELADSSKLDRLLELIRDFNDKMVIFTQFRATQDMLEHRLSAAGLDVAIFHGSLSRLAKEEAIRRFQGPARLLLCTEAGSEGRNLQFAHAVCNFDLPWNPMRIEQRVGRLSRIGQIRDVHVFNLVAAGTIEASILHLLQAKLNLFELVIGEIDMILGNLDDEREFPDLIADLWADSSGSDDFQRRMEELGNRLLAAKEAYLQQRSHDDKIFGDRFAPNV
ncbi:MAG: DEAD/DEAH box helicase [Gemmataceae bacterium]